MTKNSNVKHFNFKTLRGQEVEITCWTYSNYTGWGHKCDIWIGGSFYKTKRHSYLNRTWEAFDYETLLIESIKDLYPNKRDKLDYEFLREQIRAIEKNTREEAEAWLSTFKKAYDALSDNAKNALAKSDIILNTTDEAEAVIHTMQTLDATTALLKDEAKACGLYEYPINKALKH